MMNQRILLTECAADRALLVVTAIGIVADLLLAPVLEWRRCTF